MHQRFRPYRRALFVVASLALVAAACGGGGGEEAEPTTTVATTTTTARPTTTTTTPPDGPIQPLTGIPIDEDDELLEQPAVVVKINNNDGAARRALIGLDQADIVYEERIEGNATRFAAVFHSDLPDYVGSVRSGRTSDIDLVSNLRTPVFMYSGSNTGVARQLRDAEDNGVLIRIAEDLGNRDVLFRDPPGGGVTSLRANPLGAVEDYAENASVPEPIFSFLKPDEDFTAGQEAGAALIDGLVPAVFVWDADAERFVRYQAPNQGNAIESATVLETSDEVTIAVDNVVILFIDYTRSPIDPTSVDAQTIGQGEAWILSQGRMVLGTWARPFAPGGYALFDQDGNELELTPGKTWVSLSPLGEADLWDPERAAEFVDTRPE